MEIREVVERVHDEAKYTMSNLQEHCAVFLDRFYLLANEEDLSQEPVRYSDVPQWMYAYVAAVAELLARKFYFKSPLWTQDPFYFAPKPVFQFNAQDEYKLVLIMTAPQAFISHNIFMEPNVLGRA